MTVLGRVQYHDTASESAQILIDADGIRGNRIDPEYRWVEVELTNVRQDPRAPTFADEGLCFVTAPSCLRAPEDFDARRSDYEDELCAMLETTLDAREVILFDHTLRGRGEGRRPPSFHVHCDYNAHSARKRMRERLGEERAATWSAGHFAVVNVWRPLLHPVERSPLGFVLPSSVAPRDWIEVDIVFPDRRGQVRGLRHAPDHRWIHLEHMRPDEAAIFTVYATHGVGGVPHAAIELVDGPEAARARQSIESRAFVRFGP